MQISVRDILVESVGYSRAYKITGEKPDLETVLLTSPLDGELSIARLDGGVLVRGHVKGSVELECHRCLRTFERPFELNLSQLFAADPGDDEMPIIDDLIDLAPLVEQEIVLSLPIKILCRPDCQGIENAGVKYTRDNPARLGDQARITKGNKRGRT